MSVDSDAVFHLFGGRDAGERLPRWTTSNLAANIAREKHNFSPIWPHSSAQFLFRLYSNRFSAIYEMTPTKKSIDTIISRHFWVV